MHKSRGGDHASGNVVVNVGIVVLILYETTF